MKSLFIFILNTFVIGLFLYSKLHPYKANLNNKYYGVFNFFNNIFSPLLNFLKKIIKPFQVGSGLSIDMTQVTLLILFLVLLNFIR
jgi:hypothetical protein